MSFTRAERIADAVLFEGYLLYPYRASAPKNQVRWQFGVAAPRQYSEADGSDPWFLETEFLLRPRRDPRIHLRLRFLRVETRRVEARTSGSFEPAPSMQIGPRQLLAWEEGRPCTVDCPDIDAGALIVHPFTASVELSAVRRVEVLQADGNAQARVTFDRQPVSACLELSAVPCAGLLKMSLRIANTTVWQHAPGSATRAQALGASLVGTHVLAEAIDGEFVSVIDPPPGARDASAACRQNGLWPVMAGEAGRADLLLAAPIVLPDYPAIAPESQGDLFDSTEIDEMLSLRVLTLTDEEKREVRATDSRARDIVDRTEALSSKSLGRLHAWAHLLNPPGAAPPEQAEIVVAGVRIARGSRVVLHPKRRADAADMFVHDRVARVEGVYSDLEGSTLVAVVLDADPASDLHAWYGRFLYFGPEEIEPIAARPAE